jgi:hypothetical protein
VPRTITATDTLLETLRDIKLTCSLHKNHPPLHLSLENHYLYFINVPKEVTFTIHQIHKPSLVRNRDKCRNRKCEKPTPIKRIFSTQTSLSFVVCDCRATHTRNNTLHTHKVTYGTDRTGKHLSDAFPFQNFLKQGAALSPLPFIFASEYVFREFQGNQGGLKLNWTHRPLVYPDDVNLLVVNINIINKKF